MPPLATKLKMASDINHLLVNFNQCTKFEVYRVKLSLVLGCKFGECRPCKCAKQYAPPSAKRCIIRKPWISACCRALSSITMEY